MNWQAGLVISQKTFKLVGSAGFILEILLIDAA